MSENNTPRAHWMRNLVLPGSTWLPAPRVLLAYGGLALLALVWRWLAAEQLPWDAPDAGLRPLWQRAAVGLAVGASLAGISRLWVLHGALGKRLGVTLGAAIGVMSQREAWTLAVLSGLCEELLFRGAMQPQFGLLLTSLLFGAVHSFPERGAVSWWASVGFAWSASAILGGLAFGALFLWSGDLLAPVLAHIVLNGLNLRWLGQFGANANPESTDAPAAGSTSSNDAY